MKNVLDFLEKERILARFEENPSLSDKILNWLMAFGSYGLLFFCLPILVGLILLVLVLWPKSKPGPIIVPPMR